MIHIGADTVLQSLPRVPDFQELRFFQSAPSVSECSVICRSRGLDLNLAAGDAPSAEILTGHSSFADAGWGSRITAFISASWRCQADRAAGLQGLWPVTNELHSTRSTADPWRIKWFAVGRLAHGIPGALGILASAHRCQPRSASSSKALSEFAPAGTAAPVPAMQLMVHSGHRRTQRKAVNV